MTYKWILNMNKQNFTLEGNLKSDNNFKINNVDLNKINPLLELYKKGMNDMEFKVIEEMNLLNICKKFRDITPISLDIIIHENKAEIEVIKDNIVFDVFIIKNQVYVPIDILTTIQKSIKIECEVSCDIIKYDDKAYIPLNTIKKPNRIFEFIAKLHLENILNIFE